MSGTRLQGANTPTVTKLSEWSVHNYYDEGSFVWQKRFDSEAIDIYLCIRDHKSLQAHKVIDSDQNIYVLDSESNLPRLNHKYWYLWASGRLLDSDEKSFASINQKIREYTLSLDSDNGKLTAARDFIVKTIPLLPDSDSVDSDVKNSKDKINLIKNKKVSEFIDSDARHKELLIYDSDNGYVTKRLMRTFNSVKPEEDGNIPISLIKVLSGIQDNRPDSELNGTIYILAGDSDSDSTGSSFIYDNGKWARIISPNRTVLDSRFLKVTGQNVMTGSLLVSKPSQDNHIVNKLYVDTYVKGNKQDKFVIYDSEQSIKLTDIDSENFYVVEDKPTLHYYNKINNKNEIVGYEGDDGLPNFVNTTSIDSDLIILNTKYFSNTLFGTLTIKRNGVLENISLLSDSESNLSYTSLTAGTITEAKLIDSAKQTIIIRLSSVAILSDFFEITFLDDVGDLRRITKASSSTDWIVEGNSYDFGTY